MFCDFQIWRICKGYIIKIINSVIHISISCSSFINMGRWVHIFFHPWIINSKHSHYIWLLHSKIKWILKNIIKESNDSNIMRILHKKFSSYLYCNKD